MGREDGHGGFIVDYFREHLEQIVTIHQKMFDRLLFHQGDVPLELAELFEDAANTYLDLSERVSEHHRQQKAPG